MSLTSSTLERRYECMASNVLPQFPSSGIEAEYGNENHAKAEAEQLHPKLLAFLDQLVDVEKETSFVLDTKERKVRRVVGHRNYGELRWYEIGTTPDVWSPGVTLDYKSRKRVTSAQRNWQIKSQAVTMGNGTKTVMAGLAYLDDGFIDWGRFGPIEWNAAWTDLYELCESVEKVRSVVREFPASNITPKRGEWCSYCPSLLTCPAQRQALSLFRETPDVTALVANASDADLEDARLAKKSLEAMLEQFDRALRQRAEVQPIQLRNGKVLKVIECERQTDDNYLIKEELRKHGVDPEKFKKRITYKQIKECKP